jgi:hypothetical protein
VRVLFGDGMKKIGESTQFQLRLPLEMLAEIQAEADKAGTSTTEMIRRLLSEALHDKASTQEQVFLRRGDKLVRMTVDRKKLERLIES